MTGIALAIFKTGTAQCPASKGENKSVAKSRKPLLLKQLHWAQHRNVPLFLPELCHICKLTVSWCCTVPIATLNVSQDCWFTPSHISAEYANKSVVLIMSRPASHYYYKYCVSLSLMNLLCDFHLSQTCREARALFDCLDSTEST